MVGLLPFLLNAAPPAWWTDRSVIVSGATANDYAAVNQGQLKNIAKRALAEMDASFVAANLPVNPSDPVHVLVNGWSLPSATANDYKTVNLGQLKNVAKLFYLRFKAGNYTDRFPWDGSPTAANDYAPANIGQVKNLFSFDFTLPGAGSFERPSCSSLRQRRSSFDDDSVSRGKSTDNVGPDTNPESTEDVKDGLGLNNGL